MQQEVRLYFLVIYDNGVSLEAFRAAIGLFNYFQIRCVKFVYSLNRADTAQIFLWITLCIVPRISLSNDVELNPGPFFQIRTFKC